MKPATKQKERPAATAPWEGLERLLDAIGEPAALRSHRLETAAARRWRETGREVPEDFERLERRAVAVQLAAPSLLARIRGIVDGPILLHKGPQAASVYPDATVRGFDDLDLIIGDPIAGQRALIAAGFVEIGDPVRYRDIHHLRPLELPGLPLRVEIHRHPKWPDRLQAPRLEELLEASIPAVVNVEGIRAPSPTQHALILAAHSWAHVPLRRLRDLLDVAAAAALLDADEAEKAAKAWRLEHLWSTTLSAADGVFGDSAKTVPLRTWARHLVETRERTVFESHLQRLVCHFWGLPPGAALRAAGSRLADDFRPAADEEWDAKLRRTRIALRNAGRPRLDHDRALGPLAQRPARSAGKTPEETGPKPGENG